jgi:YesN/AraC family two-component response regulator
MFRRLSYKKFHLEIPFMSTEKTRTLLIVDDEPELVEILVSTCQSLTNNILTATNGLEALEIIRTKKIDAVLSDINMPKMSGLELLAQMREEGFQHSFVFLSGFGDRDNLAKALSYGAIEFIEKPYEEEFLLKNVNLALDLGVAINELNAEIEELNKGETVSREKFHKLNEVKREIWKMKKLDEIYRLHRNKS